MLRFIKICLTVK